MRRHRFAATIGTIWSLLAVAVAFLPPVASAEEAAEEEHDSGHHVFTVEEFIHSGVTIASAGPGVVDVAVELPAEVRPNGDRLAHIAPRFSGLVREVRKSVGDVVKPGEVLAIVESDNLSPFELRAGFAGTVIDRHIVPGETASPDKPAYIIADLSTVWVLVSAYPQVLDLVRVGRPVRIAASRGGPEIESRVSYVSPIVEEETRMVTARVVVANPDGELRPGLFVTATIENPVDAAIVVPRRAVQTVEAKPAVFVVAGEHFEVRTVELGSTGRTTVEVRSGLAAGDRVASERSFLVKAELLKAEGGHED